MWVGQFNVIHTRTAKKKYLLSNNTSSIVPVKTNTKRTHTYVAKALDTRKDLSRAAATACRQAEQARGYFPFPAY